MSRTHALVLEGLQSVLRSEVVLHNALSVGGHCTTTFSVRPTVPGSAKNPAPGDVSFVGLMAQLNQALRSRIDGFDVVNWTIRFDHDPVLVHLDWISADTIPTTTTQSSTSTTTPSSGPAGMAPMSMLDEYIQDRHDQDTEAERNGAVPVTTKVLQGFKGMVSQTWNRLWGSPTTSASKMTSATSAKASGAPSLANKTGAANRVRLLRPRVQISKVHRFGVVVPKQCLDNIRRLRLPAFHQGHLANLLILLRAFQGPRTPTKLALRLREQAPSSHSSRLQLCLTLEHLGELRLLDVQHALELIRGQKVWAEVRETVQLFHRSLKLWFVADLSMTAESLALERVRALRAASSSSTVFPSTFSPTAAAAFITPPPSLTASSSSVSFPPVHTPPLMPVSSSAETSVSVSA